MPTLEERMAALQQPEDTTAPPIEGSAEGEISPVSELSTTTAKYIQNFNIGLANVLGMPGDAIENLNKQMWDELQKATGKPLPGPAPVRKIGSEAFRDFFVNIGAAPKVGEEQEGFVPRALRLAGETSVPYGAAQLAGAKLAQKAPIMYNDLQKALVSAYQAPWRTAGAETTAILAGAGGGEVANEVFPDNHVANMMGELLGSVTPSAVMGLVKAMPTVGTMRNILSGEGATERAANRIRETVGDIDKARIRAFDATELDLDPITATGDAGLLALEKAAIDQDPKLAARIATLTSKAMETARKKVVAGGDPQATVDFLDAARRSAAAKAQTEISKLGPDIDAVTAARSIRQSVEDSLRTAREAEREVWGKLPSKGQVDPSRIEGTFREVLADRSIAADPEDIPAFIYTLLGKPDGKGGITKGAAVKTPELKVMKDFRSRLQQEIVTERAKDAPNRNKLRILGKIEDSIYDSLVEVSPEYKEAVDFSRQLNDKFTKGKIGDMLGYERTGELTTSAEGTLDFLMSGNKDDVRMGLRQLATASPESIPLVGEGIKNTFKTQAIDDVTGALNVRNANRFLQKNEHVLNEFPEIKDQIQRSVKAQRLVDELVGAPIGDRLSTYIKNKSVAALYLDGTPDKAMHRLVTAKNSEGAGAMMKQMVALTNQDPTGRATKGLKAAFGSYLLNHAETSDVNFLSGKKFMGMLAHLGPAANQLYTKPELSRLFKIGTELSKIEARELSRATKGGVISDLPNKIIKIVGGTFASRAGAQLGAGTSGASLRTASIFTKEFNEILGRLTNDGAEQILMKAVEDPVVLKTLLKEATPNNIKEANKVFKSFLTGQAIADQKGEPTEFSLEERMKRLQSETGR